jgi:acetyl-CoA acetyltransferase
MHVHVLGSFTTPFGKHPSRSYKDLVREAVTGALADARLPDGGAVASAWFGNCNMALWGQANIRGQVCLAPLVNDGLLRPRAPVTNVEGGCATGSLAFHGACKDVLAGAAELSLAIGAEKMFFPDVASTLGQFDGGIDRLDPERWQKAFAELGEASGRPFEPSPDRVLFVDVYAMKASLHMRRYGTTLEQIAAVASKDHRNGALNERAHYRFSMTPEEVLADRVVCAPLTRAMCAPSSDGASAVLVCSERFLAGLPGEVRERAVRVRAAALVGGKERGLDEPSVTRSAAERLYARGGLSPSDIDFAEVHDATSWSEIDATEALGFCPVGKGGEYMLSGATEIGGARPVNASGGLVSKGHPIGATGLAMIDEVVRQLRREAGPRQVKKARVGLAHNAGGMVGVDEATCSLVVLEG